MNILHYSLGLPPNRSGGLTKYATDLIQAQYKGGDNVALLFPGDFTFWAIPYKKIRRLPAFNGIDIFEIRNPSPVPLLHGLKSPEAILNDRYKISAKDIDVLFAEVRPDVFHIHTLMGLPPELLRYLKQKGVKIIYTSHDYFGLCLKVNFINQDEKVCLQPSGSNCELCNRNSKSSSFLRLRNSGYLLKYKNSTLLNRKINNSEEKRSASVHSPSDPQRELEYESIIQYYHQLFALIDCFHFNSLVAKSQYEQYLSLKKAVVIPISHAGIKDNRRQRDFNQDCIKLAFIGHTTEYKGFPMLKQILCSLNDTGITNWSLDVWGGATGVDPDNNKIIYKGKFSPDDLGVVFNNTDLLIVPSLWKETFSLITLEALSYGVPVMVSSNVGAKDIVSKYNSELIFEPEELYSRLEAILRNSTVLNDFSESVCKGRFDHLFENHVVRIKELYLRVIENQ